MNVQAVYSRLPLQPLLLRPSTLLSRVSKWLVVKKEARTNSRKLYVAERVSIGEKSFLSVIHIDGRRFLLATAQANVSLLTELLPEATFGEAIKEAVNASQPRPRKPRSPRARKEGASE